MHPFLWLDTAKGKANRKYKEEEEEERLGLGHEWVTYGSNGGLHAVGEGACLGLRGWARQISPPHLLHFLHSQLQLTCPL